jgi:AraC-like DNA-binding protein
MTADLVRATSLHWAPELITELGGNPHTLLGRCGIAPETVNRESRFIPFSLLCRVVGECAAELDTPDFGLRLAAKQGTDVLGPLAVAIRHSATVGEALRNNIDFVHHYSPALGTSLQDHGDGRTAYVFRTLVPGLPHRAQIAELGLRIILSKFRMIAGRGFRPLEVTFSHARRLPAAQYSAAFDCPVRFDCAEDSLVFPTQLLERRLHSADRSAAGLAIEYMRMSTLTASYAAVVSTQISRLLPQGSPTLARVAQSLGLHPRALQRRLAESHTTFAALVEAVRKDAALQLLRSPELPIGLVAQQLGYAEQSVLTRSCRRWFSLTPLAVRRRLREDPEAAALLG